MIVFGTIFNDVVVKRFDAANNVVKSIKVPIAYAPKEKVLQRVDQDPELTKPTAIDLPRMAFMIRSLSHDPSRGVPSTNRWAALSPDANRFFRQYTPAPYNIEFELYIYSKNVEDQNKIIEQILPFFRPDWTPTVEMIPEIGLLVDTPITLTPNVGVEERYEGDWEDRKVMIHTMSFIMKTYFFGPTPRKPIIKFPRSTVYALAERIPFANAAGNGEATVTIQTQPGLTANGEPTTVLAESIDPNEIYANSDFGYVTIRTTPP